MKNFKILSCYIVLFVFAFSFSSCGEDENNCITCSIAGETGPICSDDVDIWNEDTGSDLKTVSELANAIEALGGSCN